MARPKKESMIQRSHHISLRLTDMEYQIVEDAAKEQNLSRSDYIRKVLLDGSHSVTYEIVADIPELQKLTAEFGKIGSNLNQIAKYFHLGGARSKTMQDKIHECIAELFQLRNEVRKLAGDYRGNIETHRK